MRGFVWAAVCAAALIGSIPASAAERPALSANPADPAIDVAGNRHVGADLIRSYFHAGRAGRLDAEARDAALKSLYATGLFQDVKISAQGGRVVVTVVENPTIGRIAFEGNKKLKDEDLKKGLQSKESGPLSRAFVQADVMRIQELYRRRGYFEARIAPKYIAVKTAKTAKTAKAAKAADAARDDLVFEIAEGDKLAVRQIRFAGNAAFPPNKLIGIVKTGMSNVLSPLLDNDIYDADRIENDRELLRRFYLAHGYADVRVNASAEYDAATRGVVVSFAVDEGSLYRFGKVDVESSLKDLDVAALRRLLRTAPGAPYDADAVTKTVDDLEMALARNGAPFAAIAAQTERVPDRHLVDLAYRVADGRHLYVERIDIGGNTRTRDAVIRRELDVGEGDAYNRALIDRAERRLKDLGYFKSVKITTQPGSAPDRIVLKIAVEEQGTGNFSIMGGYSTAEGLLASVTISDKNLFGAGDNGKVSVTFGQYVRGVDLAFTDPYAFGQRLALGGEVFGNEAIANGNQSYDSTIYGAKISAGTPLTDQLGVTWTYSIYNQGIALDPAVGTASLPIQQAAAAGPLWVSSIGSGIAYSTLDSAKNPTSGIRVQTNNEFAGLGGAAQFAKTNEDVRYYHPIAGDVVGMVRSQGGYVTPWGGQSLPLLDGFFGGPQLVRGFAPNGFGPRDLTPGTTMDNVGGNVYWTTSAELQAPVPFVPADAKLKMALFSDTGSLWATGASSVSSLTSSLTPSQQIGNARAVRSSIGVSLIWDSMFGPLRVDYAYPIAKQPYDVTQRLNFSAGAF